MLNFRYHLRNGRKNINYFEWDELLDTYEKFAEILDKKGIIYEKRFLFQNKYNKFFFKVEIDKKDLYTVLTVFDELKINIKSPLIIQYWWINWKRRTPNMYLMNKWTLSWRAVYYKGKCNIIQFNQYRVLHEVMNKFVISYEDKDAYKCLVWKTMELFTQLWLDF